MKLLLVDDERSIRNYLRTLVDWELHGYTLLEAENGQAALDSIERENISLLLMDISMPGLSGLEVLAQLRSRQCPCVVTLLTCHDEFEYAKKALQLGCFDYVLKSDICASNILQVVERMKSALTQEQRQQQTQEELCAAAARRSRQELQNAAAYWLQSGNAPEGTFSAYLEKTLHLSMENLRFVALSLLLKDYEKVLSRYTDSNASQFTDLLEGVLRELLAEHPFLSAQPENGEFFILLWFHKDCSTQEIMAALHSVTQQIDSSFHSILNIDVTLLFSLPFWDVTQSRTLYHAVRKLARLQFFGALPSCSCLQDYNLEPQQGAALLQALATDMSAALASRNLAQIEQVVLLLSQHIHTQRIYVAPEDFLACCKRCAAQWLPSEEAAMTDWQPWDSAASAHDLIEALRTTLTPHCLTQDSNDKKNIVKKALLMIQQGYATSISLESIAKQLWVNPSYLSHMFSEAMGQSITTYINNYRIDQAKKLITGSNLKLYEIARQTGFSSPIVFSTCFKKVTGETPTEYKSRLL